jgi:DNA-binding NarL/FixJ family response regulator
MQLNGGSLRKRGNMKQGKAILADRHQNMLGSVADEASLIEAAAKLSPDLIVADLSLPVSIEVNVVRRLKKAFPGIKLIILSIHDEGSAVGECLVAGASGFVLKRTAVSDLVPAIETVLKGDIYMSPSVVQTSEKAGEN